MSKVIEVVDALPGTGKSTAIFNMMKNSIQEKWIYVSPLLSEVEIRVPHEVPELGFRTPEGKSKTDDILKLLLDGENIACTHSLFLRMGAGHWQAIKDQGYTLVLDEEVSVVEKFTGGKKGDVPLMVKRGDAEITGKGKVVLKCDIRDYEQTSQSEVADAAHKGILYIPDNANQADFLVTQVPVELVVASKRTIVLTYLFDGSILQRFLELHGIDWKPLQINLFKSNEEVIKSLREKISFKSKPAIDALSKLSLSATWYQRATREQLQGVGAAWWSVARNVPDKALITTLPKTNSQKGSKYVGRNKDRPIANSWLWAGTRATNDYAEKDVVVHLYNRYPSANVSAYFRSYGLPIDEDQFALAEMIQFVLRSAARNGKPIDLYVASPRMKKLLQTWLNSDQEEEVIE